ncbi:unnamed protein product, partial [Mesorhabditis spiculigera]
MSTLTRCFVYFALLAIVIVAVEASTLGDEWRTARHAKTKEIDDKLSAYIKLLAPNVVDRVAPKPVPGKFFRFLR